MAWLVTADLHLTDRPRDAYRFGLFPWLAKKQISRKADATVILGDLTDRKDNHSSTLVNSIIEGLTQLRPPVYILKGNHDYIDKDTPYFKFLDCIDGIRFITEPTILKDEWVTMIPHQPDQASFNKALEQAAPESTLMMHQTLDGALSETGSLLNGIRIDKRNFATILSGDVHRPQIVGNVLYVGSPYHVRFGDSFAPRVICQEPSGWFEELYYEAPRKHALKLTVQGLMNTTGLAPGDQVKITVSIKPEDIVNWAAIKRNIQHQCSKFNLEVYGIDLVVEGTEKKRIIKQAKGTDHKAIFTAFCDTEKVAKDIRQAGEELLK